MAGELVLVTGGTGLIGIKIIQLALKAGYSVRAAVRSQEKANGVLATPTVKALNPGSRLTFIIVPDILADNAYDEAVKGVKFIIHTASPVIKGEGFTPDQWETHLIAPALKGTTSILDAAYKTSGIERIVITSSEVAIIPWEEFIAKEVDTVFDDQYQIPFPAGPYSHVFEAYSASKVRALIATKEFVKEKKPEWDVINIMPSFVVGDNEMITDPNLVADGTVGAAMAQVLGGDSGWGAVPSTSVHVADVARLHVEALNPKIEGNQSFLAVSEGERGTRWEEAIDIVNRNYPQAVKKGVLPNNGTASTKRTKVDASRTEQVFGFKFQGYEEQVKSVVDQYLGLVGEQAA
ncbi:NAD(P)-binding protein [Mollisia scopiformis]|uniref:NAD(P)-binding protein n=1 Tax=Mollisia scopiformis TaxID=149040 RepID=A0A132BBF8_MOLSC|nr:NAD(P)-binding protein [Mollisia scopiformis]KUJ09721.1 NAD(P)-binding protein [Mollisia scopiformis]